MKYCKMKVLIARRPCWGCQMKACKNLKKKVGEKSALRIVAAKLQSKAAGGPLVHLSPQPAAAPQMDSRPDLVDDIAQRLEDVGIGCSGSRSRTQGEPHLKIVDFVSSTLMSEEEVVFGGGETLKMQF